MKMKKSHLIGYALIVSLSSTVNAASTTGSSAETINRNTVICEALAEKARSITHATIKSETFNAMAEVIKQTKPDSAERNILLATFQRPYLLSSVIIGSASIGIRTMPATVQVQAVKDAEDFTSAYVRNTCIVESLSPSAHVTSKAQ